MEAHSAIEYWKKCRVRKTTSDLSKGDLKLTASDEKILKHV